MPPTFVALGVGEVYGSFLSVLEESIYAHHPRANVIIHETLPAGYGAVEEGDRTCGGYTFKYIIMLKAMKASPPGSAVIYMDADTFLKDSMAPFIQVAERRGSCFFDAFSRSFHPSELTWASWSRQAVFTRMGFQREVYGDCVQPAGCCFLVRNDERGWGLMEEVLKACHNPKLHAEKEEPEDYVDHRFDQSVMGPILHSRGVSQLPFPEEVIGIQ